ncbi:hypothetical protein HPB48_017394 [Haemaphysalis longicornis]|uniref:Protein phosphatase 1 regulatory subunit 37 n=1 Tax=Haemaphysalis longicornis TaxID=44386 RepID=A0A9J6GNZ8_HAELO|nr:hypothetical protein HPB48_017394 [Haemaphysalis longicornis]
MTRDSLAEKVDVARLCDTCNGSTLLVWRYNPTLYVVRSSHRSLGLLPLKSRYSEKLDARQCEAMEDIFKAVQFDTISLESCHLDDEGAATVFDMIEYYESARKLNISHNRNIDCRGWQACSRMLKKTPCLQHLDARDTALSEQTLLVLGRALRLGSHLNSLHLENCSLTGRSLVILVAALKLNPALKELYLGDNGMSCADGLQLANLLRANTRLEYLDLRGNNLQDIGVSHLSDGIAQQPDGADKGLKTLVLWSNNISPAGMRHISRALVSTRSLVTINLGHNSIEDDGLLVLREGLMRNKSLCNLGLQNTKITCEGAIALAEFIADSQVITRLDLRENKIGVGGLMALAQSLKLSRTVTRLDLDPAAKVDEVRRDAGSRPEGSEEEEEQAGEQRRLLLEIGEQCRRNKRVLRLASVPSICNGFSGPLAPATVLDGPAPTGLPNGTVITADMATTTQATRPPLTTSLSVNAVTGGNAAPPSSPGGSRFRVSRVCLETDGENGPLPPNAAQLPNADSANLERSNSAPATIPSRFTVTPVDVSKPATDGITDTWAGGRGVARARERRHPTERTSLRTRKRTRRKTLWGTPSQSPSPSAAPVDARKDKSYVVRVPLRIVTGGCADEERHERRERLLSDGRKISFQLPEGTTGEGGRGLINGRSDRRMSTPAMPVANAAAARKKLSTLKLCKRLESLDLRSTVPLSPTRLLEGWAFPEPSVDFKYPPE